ncbi:MAG: proton-conducting transporter membrane subunit [Hyphomicrobiaceae bacterium]
MTTLFIMMSLAIPLPLIATGLLGGAVRSPRAYASLAVAAAVVSFGAALLIAVYAGLRGPLTSPTLGLSGVGLSVYVDALSAIMLTLVAFIGVVVVRYSRTYLDGDAGHVRFTRWLLYALAAVLTLILSGNLALLIVAWIATSLALNKLLVFYAERPAAQRAAAKKFWASRVGDASLIGVAALLYIHFGTLDITALSQSARTAAGAEGTSAYVVVAGLLVVLTALLKSAQLPLHGWLIEVMETPTPVSALLHAGIINAGGYLVLRLADVMLLAGPALEVLALVGGATALFGSLVMLTQTSVKVQLAYSTVAQMGFMLLQCGLGAFPAALLHIVAHSLYKAHAFLSSGSVMDLARVSWSPSPAGEPHPARLGLALALVVSLAIGVGFGFGFSPSVNPGTVALGAVLLMALVHLMAQAIDERPDPYVLSRVGGLAVMVAVTYFSLQVAMAWVTAGSLPAQVAAAGPIDLAIAVLVVVSFAALTVFQNQMARHAGLPFWQAAYVHLRHGFYLNTLANRVVLAVGPVRRGRVVQHAQHQ